MQWRRGLLLAGIHVVVAAGTLVQQETGVWPLVRAGVDRTVLFRAATWQEEPMFDFRACDSGIWDLGQTRQEEIAQAANLPVAILTGWHEPCSPTPVRLTTIVEAQLGRNMRRSEIAICSILCVLVFAEWLLVGGFPVVRPRLWWLEPGAFITICTLLCTFVALIFVHQDVTRYLMLTALLAWLYWFFVLIWKALRFGWRRWLVRAAAN
jgi:hypothetical protein